MSIRFSIITICYNAADTLPVTIESVLAQDYGDYEYVIQDGMSTDNTTDVIASYKERFEKKGISLIHNREADGGIYDAMNKGAAAAGGDYINFMNAGDCFYSHDVLTKAAIAAEGVTEGLPVIIYGDCAVYEYGRFYRFPKSLSNIGENMPFSHQSVFAASDFVRSHPFDTGFRYSADYDFLLTAYDEGVSFLDAGEFICITTADGLSSVNYHDTLMESVKILKKHGKYSHSEEELKKTEKVLRIKQFVLDHFPVFIKKYIRGRQIEKRGQKIEVNIPKWFESVI